MEMEDEFIIRALKIFADSIKLQPDMIPALIDKTAVQLTAYMNGQLKQQYRCGVKAAQ